MKMCVGKNAFPLIRLTTNTCLVRWTTRQAGSASVAPTHCFIIQTQSIPTMNIAIRHHRKTMVRKMSNIRQAYGFLQTPILNAKGTLRFIWTYRTSRSHSLSHFLVAKTFLESEILKS